MQRNYVNFIAVNKILFLGLIFLTTNIYANHLWTSQNKCIQPIWTGSHFIVLCEDKASKEKSITLLDKNLNIKFQKKINSYFHPISLIKAKDKPYLLAQHKKTFILLAIDEENLAVTQIASMDFEQYDDAFLVPKIGDTGGYVLIKNKIYIPAIAKNKQQIIPAILIFDLTKKNTKKIIFKDYSGYVPMRIINNHQKPIVWLREKDKKNFNYVLKNIEGVCKTIFKNNKIYIANILTSSERGAISILGNQSDDYRLSIYSIKENDTNMTFNDYYVPLRPLVSIDLNSSFIVYGTMVDREYKPIALTQCNIKKSTNKISCSAIDKNPSFTFPIPIEDESGKKLLGFFNNGKNKTKVYLIDIRGKEYKTFFMDRKLAPIFSKLYLVGDNIYIWHTKENNGVVGKYIFEDINLAYAKKRGND